MSLLPYAATVSRRETVTLALSALPDAPVVTDPPARPARIRRARIGIAAVLSRAATAVAPAECAA